jgi:hypothetical protein
LVGGATGFEGTGPPPAPNIIVWWAGRAALIELAGAKSAAFEFAPNIIVWFARAPDGLEDPNIMVWFAGVWFAGVWFAGVWFAGVWFAGVWFAGC